MVQQDEMPEGSRPSTATKNKQSVSIAQGEHADVLPEHAVLPVCTVISGAERA